MPSVLVVDDEKDLLEQTVDYLSFAGFEVFSATDGLQGLQMAHEQLPDIIVCDINMPELTGFEVLKELQKDSLTSAIPFIFLTARTDTTDIRSGMNLGADDYITKPFNNSDLVSAIQTRLSKKSLFERDRINSFLHRLISFQDNERHNLSTSLQDYFLDPLLGIKTMLDIVQLQSSSGEKQIFNQALESINKAIQKFNDLTLELSPSLLNHFGLLPALRWLFEQFTTRTQIKIDFRHDDLSFDFDSEQKIMIYRIIQEAITNIEKHASVNEAFVRLWIEDEMLHLQIYDEGVGFNVAEALNASNNLGLLSMQIRASILGSKMTFISTPKEGTQIIAQFPLRHTRHDTAFRDETMSELMKRVDDAVTQQPLSLARTETARDELQIVIAESNDLIRWGIRKLLEGVSHFLVIAEALTGKQLLNRLGDLNPDILILSMTLPDVDSFDLVQYLHDEYEELPILVISNYSEKAYARKAIASGASGYILKTADSVEILHALTALASGEHYMSEGLHDLDDTQKSEQSASEAPLDLLSNLTKRELEIFYLVIEGNSNKEIADKLFVSPRTAETHRLNMMRKLGMKGQATLIRYAISKGIIASPK